LFLITTVLDVFLVVDLKLGLAAFLVGED